MKTITLKSGVQIPQIGLGTFDIPEKDFNQVITEAWNLGYQFFDSATGYQNHVQLASSLKSQQNVRPIICTKFNNGDLIAHKTVDKVVNQILHELGSEQIDFLLLHNPKVENFRAVFEELIELKMNNKIKSIGVSNFTIKHLDRLQDVIEHVDLNEIELHPFLTQIELVQYCKKHNIKIIAYRPFGFGSLEILENKTLINIAKKYTKSTAQIILRWLCQQGHISIPKACSKLHLKDNIEIFDFSLTDENINEINSLNKGLRTCTGPWAEFDDAK